MKGWFEEECLHSIKWYLDNDNDPGPFVARRRFLLQECQDSMNGTKNFGDGITYWFEPIIILFHGPVNGGFRFSYPSKPNVRQLGLENEWEQFTRLAELFPKPAIWHFLGAREFKVRRQAKNVEPICLINTPNLTADVLTMYATYRSISDHKLIGFDSEQYIDEAIKLNKNFNERVTCDG